MFEQESVSQQHLWGLPSLALDRTEMSQCHSGRLQGSGYWLVENIVGKFECIQHSWCGHVRCHLRCDDLAHWRASRNGRSVPWHQQRHDGNDHTGHPDHSTCCHLLGSPSDIEGQRFGRVVWFNRFLFADGDIGHYRASIRHLASHLHAVHQEESHHLAEAHGPGHGHCIRYILVVCNYAGMHWIACECSFDLTCLFPWRLRFNVWKIGLNWTSESCVSASPLAPPSTWTGQHCTRQLRPSSLPSTVMCPWTWSRLSSFR